jgi:hypothetical protein
MNNKIILSSPGWFVFSSSSLLFAALKLPTTKVFEKF